MNSVVKRIVFDRIDKSLKRTEENVCAVARKRKNYTKNRGTEGFEALFCLKIASNYITTLKITGTLQKES